MIEWVTSNIALPDNSSYLPEVHVQNDHNVAVHSDQTGCPPSALKPFVTPETIVMLPSVMYYYTHEDFSLKTRNVPSSGIINPTKTGINQEKTTDEEKKKKRNAKQTHPREDTAAGGTAGQNGPARPSRKNKRFQLLLLMGRPARKRTRKGKVMA